MSESHSASGPVSGSSAGSGLSGAEETSKQSSAADTDLPLSYARTLSWLSLVVILLTSLGLSFFISNSARETLLTRQEEFARLLVENLNSQIFRRFALPTILASGVSLCASPRSTSIWIGWCNP